VKSLRFLLGCIVLACATAPIAAQPTDASQLTLERIFASPEFFGERFGPARWLETGAAYTTLETSAATRGGRDIVRYDAASGNRTVLVPASRLIPRGQTQPLGIADYTWSNDGRKLLIFTNTRRVWRSNTRGDYWALSLDDWVLHQVGAGADPATLMFAKFSPDGTRVGYVRENNLFVEDLASGQVTQLTNDGSATIVNGTSDWVYEEEFFLRDCFRWSPDGNRIAYWQFDTEGVKQFHLINDTDSLYPKIISFPYPKAGETNSAARIGVVPAAGGETVWMDIPGDPRNTYIPWMEWAANSDQIVLQHLNRLQNTNNLLMGDVATGDVRTILTETDDAWLDVVADLHWLNDGSQFTWMSERDGWRHLYLVSRSGEDVRLITDGEYDVVSVEAVDQTGGWVYFIAAPENPTQRYLYRVGLSGDEDLERITPNDQTGTNSYQISHDAKWAIHQQSTFGVPPVTDLVELPDHRVARTLVQNAALRDKVAALDKAEAEFFRVDNGGGVPLDCWMMKPPDFDPGKRYPVLFYVYGEPWGQTVADTWGGSTYLWHLMLTQQGYIVASVDNRGTPAPRGRDWRKVIYRKIGVYASADQAAALREIEQRPYVDPDRIGIWGWSGGGSMTLNMMFRYPDLYSVGMAVAPVPDLRYYDTIYQERYMGLPQENALDYEQASPITFADRLKGHLLIVHGTGDDNVHYQGTEALINRLIEANRQFTMMAYPNRSHGIYEGRGTTLHLRTLLTGYLKENMPAGGR
jgi:dipeptidyl-peptidase-4